MALKTWDEKLKKVTNVIKEVTSFPAEQIAAAGTSFYKKLDAVNNYKPTGHFRGEITLVKAKDNYVQLSEDYELSQVINILYLSILYINSLMNILLVRHFENNLNSRLSF